MCNSWFIAGLIMQMRARGGMRSNTPHDSKAMKNNVQNGTIPGFCPVLHRTSQRSRWGHWISVVWNLQDKVLAMGPLLAYKPTRHYNIQVMGFVVHIPKYRQIEKYRNKVNTHMLVFIAGNNRKE